MKAHPTDQRRPGKQLNLPIPGRTASTGRFPAGSEGGALMGAMSGLPTVVRPQAPGEESSDEASESLPLAVVKRIPKG
jgi:hypothetical protein